jgi:hypothetical protein
MADRGQHAGAVVEQRMDARVRMSFRASATWAISSAGDAYDLASSFSDDFSKLVVTGATPFGKAPELPSFDKIGASFGGKPKYAACEAFGRNPGLIGMAAGKLGLPPEWSDKAPEATGQ